MAKPGVNQQIGALGRNAPAKPEEQKAPASPKNRSGASGYQYVQPGRPRSSKPAPKVRIKPKPLNRPTGSTPNAAPVPMPGLNAAKLAMLRSLTSAKPFGPGYNVQNDRVRLGRNEDNANVEAIGKTLDQLNQTHGAKHVYDKGNVFRTESGLTGTTKDQVGTAAAPGVRYKLDAGVPRSQLTPAERNAADQAAKKRGVPISENYGRLDPFGGSGLPLEAAQKQDSIHAAGVKVLSQLARPAHALAGAELGFIKGGPIGAQKGAYEGLVKNKPFSHTQVLGALGVPKGPVRSVGGTALDLVTDPLNFVSGGTGGVAEAAARKAATRVETKAVAKGLKPEVAQRLGQTAGKRAAAVAPKGRGVVVKVAGKPVPSVTPATAAAGRAVKRVVKTKRARPVANVGSAVRGGVADVSPFVRPVGATHTQAFAGEEAARTARATRNTGLAAAEAKARGVAARLKPGEHQMVIDAIESGNLGSLPKHLTEVTRHADGSVKSLGPARELRDTMKHVLRQQRAAGVPIADITKGGTRRLDWSAYTKPKPRVRTTKVATGPEPRPFTGPRYIKTKPDKYGDVYLVDQAYGRRTLDKYGTYNLEKLNAEAKPLQRATTATKTETVEAPGFRVEPTSGKGPQVKGYFPHEKIPTDAETTHVGGSVGVKRASPGAGKARTIKEPLSTVRKKTPGLFDENVPTVYANALRNASNAIAQGTLHRNLAKLGRSIKPGRDFRYNPKTETVYRLYAEGTSGQKASRLVELDEKQIAGLGQGKAASGQYFVANKGVVDKAMATAGQPVGRDSTLLKGVDKVTGGWKRLATASPGFNVRNFVGDTEMAYRNTPARLLPRNMLRSARTVKAQNRFERAQAKGETPKPTKAGYAVPGEGFKTYDTHAAESRAAGGMRAGFVGRELTDLQHRALQEGKSGVEVKVKPSLTTRGLQKVKLKKLAAKQPAPGKRLNRYLQNREDVPRGATYAHYRAQGLSKDTASRVANREHIDYGNLTPAEKNVFRRIFPFYTFTARNIPNVARTLVQRPGKFANYELLREDASKALGLPADWQGNLTEGEQRQLGIPANLPGLGKVNISYSLPLTDLNEIPTSLNPAAYMTEAAHKAWSLANPGIKIPFELLANYNDYFRSAIQDPHHPLVPAPAWVKYLPGGVKKAFGVVDGYKGKSGSWAWDGKAGYVFSGLNPGLLNSASNLLTQGNVKSQSLPQKLAGTPSLGAKLTPLSPQTAKAKLDSLYKQAGTVSEQIAGLGQRNINAKNDPRGEWAGLRAKQKQLQSQIYSESAKAGVKLPGSGAPPKPKKVRKKSSGGSIWGGGGGSSGGSSGGGSSSGGGGSGSIWGDSGSSSSGSSSGSIWK